MYVWYNLHFLVSQHRSGKLQIQMRLRTDLGAGGARAVRIQSSSACACAHAGGWQRQFVYWRRCGRGCGWRTGAGTECSCCCCRRGCRWVRLSLLGNGVISFTVLQFGTIQRLLTLLGVKVPDGNSVAGAVSGLDFMRITFVWPEENQTIKLGLNIRHCCARRWSNTRIIEQIQINFIFLVWIPNNLPQYAATLSGIPVDVQVVYGCNDASVLVGIVHMHNIMCARTRIASDHSLK